MSKKVLADLVKKEEIIKDIYKFTIKSEQMANEAKPGQFLEINVSTGEAPMLRRPISIYNIDKENNLVEFIFMVRGKGTKILSERQVGDKIDIMGPLGNGTFSIDEYKNVSIIGGGIGIYPLHELAKQLKDKGVNVTTYVGFRNKELVHLEKEFKSVSNNLIISTDDGTYGKKGFGIDFLKEDSKETKPDAIFACGPLPMLKAVKKFAEENNIYAEISLEERMGCGIGACLGCAVKTKKDDIEKYSHVCVNGPVFKASIVNFEN